MNRISLHRKHLRGFFYQYLDPFQFTAVQPDHPIIGTTVYHHPRQEQVEDLGHDLPALRAMDSHPAFGILQGTFLLGLPPDEGFLHLRFRERLRPTRDDAVKYLGRQ
jgi:hypothetical protein